MLRVFGEAYYPTLILRGSEMRGLQELPEFVKDQIFPIFLLCPWGNSNLYENSHRKIGAVYGNRPKIIDLDCSYSSQSDRPAVAEHQSVVQGEDSAARFLNFLTPHPSYIPCFPFHNCSDQELPLRLRDYLGLNRGVVVRFELSRSLSIPKLHRSLQILIQNAELNEFMLVVDVGYITDVNTSALVANRVIEPVSGVEGLNVVLSSSSFPTGFVNIEGVVPVENKSRQLLSLVQRRYNQLVIRYSDWGGTRPRNNGFGRPVPRLDFAQGQNWILSRNKNLEWGYQEAATALLHSAYMRDAPNIWAVEQIRATALGGADGISSPQRASAVRVNSHLFSQNSYGEEPGGLSTDEPWVDDL